jgi:D-alanyl-D-alanine carboxypeptidase-like protein
MPLYELQEYIQPYAYELMRLAQPYGAQVTSVLRTTDEQRALYQTYLRGGSRYPAAPPGHSMHERGRAFDVSAPAWVLYQMGRLWEWWGGRWGGRGGDPIHFEA